MSPIVRPISSSLVIAGLILTGAVADHVVSQPQYPVIAAQKVSQYTAAPVAVDQQTATERAFGSASRSVVYIDNVGIGSGSGVIFDPTGNIVTNAHVVSGAQSVKVTLSTGKVYTAKVVGADPADDLAVLKINGSNLPTATFASASSYRIAETVLAIGSPLGLQQSVTSGLISALHRTVQEANGAYLPDAIQTSAPINPGNSGGALVDLSGAVVGIPTLEATDAQNNNGGAAQGIGFAVSSARVSYVANQLVATGHVAHTGRAYLGVSIAANTPDSFGTGPGGLQGGNTPVIEGALVNTVSGPAAAAGIRVQDIITALNGTPITSQDDLLAFLATQKPGKTIAVSVNRQGSMLTIHVHLGELPAS